MKIFIILLFAILNTLYATNSCLNNTEREKINQEISDEFYQNVANIIECNSTKSSSSFLIKVCQNSDLLNMFKVLSQANVYTYENATKKEVDHKIFNKSHLYFDVMKYKNDKTFNSLCFDLKKSTTDLLGGLSPYKQVELFNKTFFLQKNKHGAILSSKNGYKIYLGNKCDVLDSKNNYGFWYKNKDKYIIEINNDKINLHTSEIDLKEYSCDSKKVSVYRFEKIITKFPNRTVAYYNLGDAYWVVGDKKKAIKAYTTYIEQMCHKGLQKKIPKEVLERVNSKVQQQALIQYIDKNLNKFKIVTYKDADLYNDTIEESKRFSRLGMVNLSKYFDKNRLEKIQIKFDDYFEKATSEYYFNHGKLFYVKKTEVFGPHKKEISHFYFNGNKLEKCITRDQKSCLNEKRIILHDIVRYIKYPENDKRRL